MVLTAGALISLIMRSRNQGCQPRWMCCRPITLRCSPRAHKATPATMTNPSVNPGIKAISLELQRVLRGPLHLVYSFSFSDAALYISVDTSPLTFFGTFQESATK